MDGMEDQQDLLFAALKRSDWKDAKHILSAHPELINMRRKVWKDGFEIEDLTPLIEACRQDWQNIVKFLLDNGANAQATGYLHFETNVNCRLTRAISRETTANLGLFRGGFGALDGVFPLFAAGCVEARVTIIKKLLSAGADVNQRTAMGQTALHALCAARLLMNELREVSLDDGADDYAGHSFNNYKAVKIEALIKYGSDVNICDDLGKSPLHYAAKFGQNVIAKILIRNGANVFLKDKLGLTALEYAAVENRRLTMALIEKYAFPIERIILAYECVAIHHWDPIEPLRKATLLREQHGISKTVLPPFECYGFEKEWETVEELEKHAAECADGTLFLQCVLARERISVENGLDIAQEDREDGN